MVPLGLNLPGRHTILTGGQCRGLGCPTIHHKSKVLYPFMSLLYEFRVRPTVKVSVEFFWLLEVPRSPKDKKTLNWGDLGKRAARKMLLKLTSGEQFFETFCWRREKGTGGHETPTTGNDLFVRGHPKMMSLFDLILAQACLMCHKTFPLFFRLRHKSIPRKCLCFLAACNCNLTKPYLSKANIHCPNPNPWFSSVGEHL